MRRGAIADPKSGRRSLSIVVQIRDADGLVVKDGHFARAQTVVQSREFRQHSRTRPFNFKVKSSSSVFHLHRFRKYLYFSLIKLNWKLNLRQFNVIGIKINVTLEFCTEISFTSFKRTGRRSKTVLTPSDFKGWAICLLITGPST